MAETALHLFLVLPKEHLSPSSQPLPYCTPGHSGRRVSCPQSLVSDSKTHTYLGGNLFLPVLNTQLPADGFLHAKSQLSCLFFSFFLFSLPFSPACWETWRWWRMPLSWPTLLRLSFGKDLKKSFSLPLDLSAMHLCSRPISTRGCWSSMKITYSMSR